MEDNVWGEDADWENEAGECAGEDEDDEYDGEGDDDEWYDDFTMSSGRRPAVAGGPKKPPKPASRAAAVRRYPGRPALDRHELALVVSEWRASSRRSSAIDPVECQEVLTLTLAYLKERYADHFPATSSSTTATPSHGKARVVLEKVTLVFPRGGQEIQCQPSTGQIEFGMDAIKKEFYDGARSKYLLENDYMHQVCQTKEDVLMWFLLHEFCHLFVGFERHGAMFFKKVISFSKDNMFLFGLS